jgi:hypothetical protein
MESRFIWSIESVKSASPDGRRENKSMRQRLNIRIERLERQAGIGEPLQLTIAFFDSILDGTISDEEFARYAPTLRKILPLEDLCGTHSDRGVETVTMKAIIRRLCRLEEVRVVREQEGPSPVELIRERRRRRAEASGEPFEERPRELNIDDQDGPLSVADILRAGRMRAAALNTGQGSLPVN